MWRKPTDTKPGDAKPSSERPNTTAAPAPPAPVSKTSVDPAPAVAATPVPAPAPAPSAPVYAAPVPKAEAPRPGTRDIAGGSGTSIGSGLKIRGEVSGSSDLYVDGDVQGKISITGARVTVGVNGRVHGDVEARDIAIEGTVDGNLKAQESVRLGPSSNVQGSILTPRIGIDDGARLRGKVEMTRGDAKSLKSAGSSARATSPDAAPAYNTVSVSAERE